MVFYNEDLIEEIRSSNDIVDVISQYVVLKRSGRNFFGLCPFHKEKSPSFSVSPDKQIFHCFGCGAGGNVIHFISKIEGLDFKDTLELLANRVNIELPTLDNLEDEIPNVLELVRKGMYEKALKRRESMTYKATTLEEIIEIAENKPGFIKAMWCGSQECEEKLKESAGISSRCIPFEQEKISDTCVCCGKKADNMLYWGKSY